MAIEPPFRASRCILHGPEAGLRTFTARATGIRGLLMDVKPHHFGDEVVVVRLLLSKFEVGVECRVMAESSLSIVSLLATHC